MFDEYEIYSAKNRVYAGLNFEFQQIDLYVNFNGFMIQHFWFTIGFEKNNFDEKLFLFRKVKILERAFEK